jgi:hypothetical protein
LKAVGEMHLAVRDEAGERRSREDFRHRTDMDQAVAVGRPVAALGRLAES